MKNDEIDPLRDSEKAWREQKHREEHDDEHDCGDWFEYFTEHAGETYDRNDTRHRMAR
jgi:hypothetical protein